MTLESRCLSHPALVSLDHVVPLEVAVAPEDFSRFTHPGFEDDFREVLTGVIADQVARKSGYRIVAIRGVDYDTEPYVVKADAQGAR